MGSVPRGGDRPHARVSGECHNENPQTDEPKGNRQRSHDPLPLHIAREAGAQLGAEDDTKCKGERASDPMVKCPSDQMYQRASQRHH